MPRVRKSTAPRAAKAGRPRSLRRGRRPSRPAPSFPLVTPSWRGNWNGTWNGTWGEGGHRITLSLAGSAGAAVVVVLEWWLRSH
ncbi:hypothetical protein OHS33_35055 [Streptomyces sp. NBC_00536]|uniref:hypothetical protein n=1 Tax=Streptomyces sp. NBC_00536 TaxID=2975769 RepID=UPI002E7FC63D|nr:hypothetical protein [Streptomyces sp. NBC_00536]WUC83133.1 hypothetical protein OHS33_35055 [Streptomyces sp. NBC_00536]